MQLAVSFADALSRRTGAPQELQQKLVLTSHCLIPREDNRRDAARQGRRRSIGGQSAVPDPKKFNVVLEAELKQIDARRRQRDLNDGDAGSGAVPAGAPAQEPSPETVRQEAHKRQLVGLAFSGGGIRSATFNLGLLQGLA